MAAIQLLWSLHCRRSALSEMIWRARRPRWMHRLRHIILPLLLFVLYPQHLVDTTCSLLQRLPPSP